MKNYNNIHNDFFYELEQKGFKITSKQKERITSRLNNVITYEPRIGVFGKTGVGKSSLCNALFGSEICQISDVQACTRNAKEVLINLGGNGIKLIDVPGVGESSERDEEYANLYAELLPELDLILWVIKSDDRALASDEKFYKKLVKSHIDKGKPFLFVLNQVDKIEPFREWDEEKHEPGVNQFRNIHKKISDVSVFFEITNSKVIPVSANEKYNLTNLVDEFIMALPREKKITAFKSIDDNFKSEKSTQEVKTSFLEVVEEIAEEVIGGISDIFTSVFEKTVGNIFNRTGCYITTATCKSLNKADDCYELTKFREFRDNWLLKQDDGYELIKKYYEDAPKIVSKIESLENNREIYDKINENYLKPCLSMIENKEFKKCKELYSKMVNDLDKEYL